MTPLHVQILLHYQGRPTPYSAENRDHQLAPATVEYHADLVRDGLLDRLADPNEYGCSFLITDRGRALVTAICNTPLPQLVKVWVVRHQAAKAGPTLQSTQGAAAP